jgi:ribosome-binding protein aMBF1 (putative translation factor)
MSKSPKTTREMTSLDDMAVEWFKDPKFVKAYNDLEEEFSLLGEIMRVRAKTGLTQAEIAERMQTTQAAVARLEGGKTLPSTRTLQRFAKATGHRLKITFEPEPTG